MAVADKIREKLTQALGPRVLEIVDESEQHQGHAGARPGGESHFRVKIVSEAFEGLGRVERQRLVNRALAQELSGPVHALAMETRTPAEAAGST